MKEIAIKTEVLAVGFERTTGLRFTNAQLLLLSLINDKMRNKEPLKIDDVRVIFAKCIRSGPVREFCYYNGIHGYHDFKNGLAFLKEFPTRYDWRIMNSWLPRNLGALVLKGALVTIPVMQFGEDALKGLD